ncbi:hypothetical protein BGZ83_005396, partial [Gryganskiella cystojenkinii]
KPIGPARHLGLPEILVMIEHYVRPTGRRTQCSVFRVNEAIHITFSYLIWSTPCPSDLKSNTME